MTIIPAQGGVVNNSGPTQLARQGQGCQRMRQAWGGAILEEITEEDTRLAQRGHRSIVANFPANPTFLTT